MKPGIVCPNPLGAELGDCPRAAEAGAKAVVARPGLFVDDSFALRVDPGEIPASLSGAGLELVGLWAEVPLMGEGGDDSAGSAYIKSSLDLIDALRDSCPAEALPVVVFDAGSGSRAELWPKLVEAAKVMATSRGRGSIFSVVAAERAIGASIAAAALFEMTEVNRAVMK